ncbi:MAG: hypothetical protein MJE68_10255, partial [Proteobacteria bacterium]|nr:hypothetical protein [Pseudomonadota bacterium]
WNMKYTKYVIHLRILIYCQPYDNYYVQKMQVISSSSSFSPSPPPPTMISFIPMLSFFLLLSSFCLLLCDINLYILSGKGKERESMGTRLQIKININISHPIALSPPPAVCPPDIP